MGALVGAVYAKGENLDYMKDLAINLGAKRLSFIADPALSKTGLISGRKINNMLKSIFGDMEFQNLEIPFACLATDIENGREVVIKQGLVREGVQASCSIPVILPPIKQDGRYLVDGGMVNPVPVDILKRMGADFVIAVNVTSLEVEDSSGLDGKRRKQKAPNMFGIAFQTVNIISSQRLKSCLAEADIVISPQLTNIGRGDFHRASECIYQGELAALEYEQEIKRLIKNECLSL
jgi:NTE family protein